MENTILSEGQLLPAARIWILEDDADIGYILKLFLNDEGFEAVLLTSANNFRTALRSELPDLFLMDVMLPDGDGIGLCMELKGDQRSRHIPVLMMSANADLDRVRDCEPNGFIPKPFDLLKVLSCINGQLGRN